MRASPPALRGTRGACALRPSEAGEAEAALDRRGGGNRQARSLPFSFFHRHRGSEERGQKQPAGSDFLGERRIAFDAAGDRANGVKDRRMVASARQQIHRISSVCYINCIHVEEIISLYL